MKTIGMIGGTSWVSTLEYYRQLNEETNRQLGGLEAARCLLFSYNFADIARLKALDPEQGLVRDQVIQAAEKLAAAGAEILVLCANTLHMFAADVERAVPLPLVHIAAATAAEIQKHGLTRVGLLGTRATMEKEFYRERLAAAGIATVIPELAEREFIDRAIMTEMVKGIFRGEVRLRFLETMKQLADQGAQGIVMGCTEIPLLMGSESPGLPLFDTLAIHVRAAVALSLAAGSA
jgi:aspartate racemase